MATEVVCLQQRVLMFEGQAGELRGVVRRRVTITGVVLETDGSITWKEKSKKLNCDKVSVCVVNDPGVGEVTSISCCFFKSCFPSLFILDFAEVLKTESAKSITTQ